MSDLVNYTSKLPVPISGTEIAVDAALESFQRALDAGVAIAKSREDGKTARALILAKQEIELKTIDAQTKRGIANDRNLHERRLELIRSIGKLMTENAASLTPEIMDAAKFLLEVLREEQ